MLLSAFLRLLGSRCPECFKLAGPGAVRHGMQLFCSAEHQDKYFERGDVTKRVLDRPGGAGCTGCWSPREGSRQWKGFRSGGERMTGKWFGLASIFTGFGTSVCCLGPVVFSLLGLSSVTSITIQANLLPYRNWLLGVSGLFIGAAFYLTYRRGRPRRPLDEALLWISTAITVALLFYTIGAEGL